MDTARDEVQEELLGYIIARGSDAVYSLFLNDTDGLEGEGEQAGYGDIMSVQEEEHEDGSSDRTECGQVYILVKPMLTS